LRLCAGLVTKTAHVFFRTAERFSITAFRVE
jgi:hypothetical protein